MRVIVFHCGARHLRIYCIYIYMSVELYESLMLPVPWLDGWASTYYM